MGVIMKICPKCGNKNLDEASFCESCGAEIKDVTPVRYEYPNENKRTIIETKVDYSPLIIGCIVLLLSLLNFVSGYINFPNPYATLWFSTIVSFLFRIAFPGVTFFISCKSLLKNSTQQTVGIIGIVLSGVAAIFILINFLAQITYLINYAM